MGTIFIAGSYGVGKSTLCEKLSHKMELPFYSAGDIISKVNGEVYGANKAVSDKSGNQEILSVEINKVLKIHPNIFLAGHFCIFNRSNQVEHLPTEVFSNLHIEKILLLESSPERIVSNLGMRDGKIYTVGEIQELIVAENTCAKRMAEQIACPLFVHNMQYDASDVEACLALLTEGEG